jgi:N-acetylmuramic acid 6-phosphate etherase
MQQFQRVTEQPSKYRHLEQMSIHELLVNINAEDKTVPLAVEAALPQIERLVEAITDKMLSGGRLFYLGAGTSGRLGVVDAMFKAVEFAEDSTEDGWNDLEKHQVSPADVVVGIAASGTTPYVIGALNECRKRGIITGSITCNPNAPVSAAADFPIEVVVGPEFVTGSTRMKSGTAQKLVLNMISTSVMIQLGRVEDNKMVNMLLSNEKLLDRGVKMLMEKVTNTTYEKARHLLLEHGSVKKAVEAML